jgi:hypothetical protein
MNFPITQCIETRNFEIPYSFLKMFNFLVYFVEINDFLKPILCGSSDFFFFFNFPGYVRNATLFEILNNVITYNTI